MSHDRNIEQLKQLAYEQSVLSSVAVKPPTLGGGYKATHTL